MGCCLLSERIEPLVLASLPVTSPNSNFFPSQAWCDRHQCKLESKAGEQNETGEQTGEQNHVLLLFSEGNSNPFTPTINLKTVLKNIFKTVFFCPNDFSRH